MMVLAPNLVSSIVALALVCTVVFRLLPFIARDVQDDLFNLSRGMIWIFAGLMLSLAYWDVFGSLLAAFDPEIWERWIDATRGTVWANTIRNLCWSAGAVFILRALPD